MSVKSNACVSGGGVFRTLSNIEDGAFCENS